MEPKQRLVVAVLVSAGKVIAVADNKHECQRIGHLTGQGYELCEGCQYHNHAEAKALAGIEAGQYDTPTLFLFGHYYACDPCKEACGQLGVSLVIIG